MPRLQTAQVAVVTLVLAFTSACIEITVAPQSTPGDEIPAYQEVPPLVGHLTLGQTTDLISQTIGAAGGTLEAGGLRISVPDGALSGDTEFHVQQAAINGADFGGLISPITPFFIVDDGEAALGALVTLTMAATVPTGATAMAFYYDDAAGTITPLIPIAQDGSSLTVGATHFSGLFGALVDRNVLPVIADSGFRPGKDDWEFVNVGSYVAPDGHCNGQSASAIWYYVNQYRKAGAPRLYGLYDNNGAAEKTPDFWQDDSYGYRFASIVQVDKYANPFTVQYFGGLLDEPNDSYTYEAFRAAIATTAEPQLVWIGNDTRHVAHAVVVYRVEEDQLLVADPNYPAKLRAIPYDPSTGKLGPYSSGENAAEIEANGATLYTRFAFLPWRSNTSEQAIAAHWEEFKAGSAGQSEFPRYDLEVRDSSVPGNTSWAPLVDHYTTVSPAVKIRWSNNDVSAKIYRGSKTSNSRRLFDAKIDLEIGANPFGILLEGRRDWGYKYIDFVRLTIDRAPTATATPSTGTGTFTRAAVRMEIAGQNVRATMLSDVRIQMTGARTFESLPSETRVQRLSGIIADGDQSVTLTITFLDDPSAPAGSACPNQTIVRDIPLTATDPATGTRTFSVSGWDSILAAIDDTYPYVDNTGTLRCMNEGGWTQNSDVNPNPVVYISLGN